MLPAPALAEPGGDPHPGALPGKEVGHATHIPAVGAEVGVEVEVVRHLLQEHRQVVRAERGSVRPPWPSAFAQEGAHQALALGVDLVRAEVGAQGEAPVSSRTQRTGQLLSASRKERRKAPNAAATRSGLWAPPSIRRRSEGNCPATKQRYSGSS